RPLLDKNRTPTCSRGLVGDTQSCTDNSPSFTHFPRKNTMVASSMAQSTAQSTTQSTAQSPPTSIQFTEKMRGFISFGKTNYQAGFEAGQCDGIGLMFQLTIRATDIDKFVASPQHEAEAIGYIDCGPLGG